jgi:large subunit ribosomal protein L13
MKTASIGNIAVSKKHILIDAEGLVLGRLASRIAIFLKGKHKAGFVPNAECGDVVVVVNCEKIALTAKKMKNKLFHWHTNYPGGIRSRKVGESLSGPSPERVLYKAVERMINKGPLRYKLMRNLKIYSGADHPHDAQSPAPFDFASVNRKNQAVS